MLIDTHAHLYWDSFKKDFDEMIQRSLNAGVSTIVNVGVDIETSKEALKQTQKLLNFPGLSVFSTIGIHPHEAIKYAADPTSIQNDINILEQVYQSGATKVVAIGECGLDFLFNANDLYPNTSLPESQIKDLQETLLQAQIDLAKKLNLPLVIHCRDDRSQNLQNSECWDKVVEITQDHFGIYHCYSGLEQTTKRIIEETNFLISFAASITYPKNEYLREAAKLIPLDRIVLETDCPFLPPQHKRGQRNEPSSVKELAELVANLKGVSLEEVAEQTSGNAKKIFEINK
ncbi:TatD family hydrolase [Patescibacteria group bacterium]|nr:TatD family hydrolase [Patescibacteria group bacterium]